MDEKQRNRILSWIEETMKESGFSKMVIDLDKNEKGEGMAADIVFAEVTDKEDNNRKAYLVIKMGKDIQTLRELLPMLREVYKRELFVYDNVFPTFRKFEAEKNIVSIFDSYPKCYKIFLTDNMEVLILENLRKKGFALHDIKKPMNLQHIHLVLKSYAKLHALSFALRDQNQDEFNKLTENYSPHMRPYSEIPKRQRVQENLKKGGRNDLVVKYEEEINRGRDNVLDDVIPDESVITHGDCNNNNFLFQYKDNDVENPCSVSIIDWANSSLLSPVVDLSNFLYGSCGETLSRLEELLKFYHTHLENFLRQLGSDVEKLFPYSTLVKHWRKYSLYAFHLRTSILHLNFVEKEDFPSFEDVEELEDMDRMIEGIELKHDGLYRERLISLVDHHCNFKLT